MPFGISDLFDETKNSYNDWISRNSKNDQNDNSPANYQRDWVANPASLEELSSMSSGDLGTMFAGGNIEGFDAEKFEELYGTSKPQFNFDILETLFESTGVAQDELRNQALPGMFGKESGFMESGRDIIAKEEARGSYQNKFSDILLNRDLGEQKLYSSFSKEINEWLRWLTHEDVFTQEYWDSLGGDNASLNLPGSQGGDQMGAAAIGDSKIGPNGNRWVYGNNGWYDTGVNVSGASDLTGNNYGNQGGGFFGGNNG